MAKEEGGEDIEIQEKGEIYFFYRPKVEKEEAHSSDDVQRMYIVLRPTDSGDSSSNSLQLKQDDNNPTPEGGKGSKEVNIENQSLLRFIVMGRKSLPDPTQRSGRPFWGFVEMVTTNTQDIKDALKGEEYDTATRGHRHNPPASALGEGVYRILKHHTEQGKTKKTKKMHTHLIYKLQLPSEEADNQPQEALNVEKEASFLIQIKNPTLKGKGDFRGLKRKRKPVFPEHLQREFGKLRYHAADPPDFLNYQGCEFLLISASDNVQQELGLEIEEDEKEETHHDASCSDLLKTFGETASTDALLRGVWV